MRTEARGAAEERQEWIVMNTAFLLCAGEVKFSLRRTMKREGDKGRGPNTTMIGIGAKRNKAKQYYFKNVVQLVLLGMNSQRAGWED